MSEPVFYFVVSASYALGLIRHPDSRADPYPDIDDEEWLRRARRGEIKILGAVLMIKDFVRRENEHVVH